ncbi:Trehalose-phosphatase [Yarrowia sp. C11]|nr:Trehalose-phosphatase [Yarrowia sp. E02]KAG5369588.1 Trehalose-phosphatase [Yarrowia sp. C11]
MLPEIITPTTARELNVPISGRVINCVTTLPYEIYREGAAYKIRPRRGNSALYSALDYMQAGDGETTWTSSLVAWTGEIALPAATSLPDLELYQKLTEEDKTKLEKELTEAQGGTPTHPIWTDSGDTVSTGYNEQLSPTRRYAENILWPILHYIQGEPTDGRDEKKWWSDYEDLNRKYCDKVLEIYKEGDIIWIHDYYLFLLPKMIREKLPDARIGFFMHAPFPSSEYFRCLAKRQELLQGVLASNLISTQSEAYKRHFMSACSRIVGAEAATPTSVYAYGQSVSVVALPIGIDTANVEADAFTDEITEKVQAIRQLYPDKKIIVGRDRLDSVRGVVQKLYAFDVFLKRYPEWRDRVVLVQVTSHTATGTRKVEKKVAELVSSINGRYGAIHFSPVHHYTKHIAREEYLALLRVADLCLITSVRDGMNTTALEFIVCQNGNNSPLILSEFTGSAGNLPGAILVNPWDAVGVAEQINRAFRMGQEEKLSIEEPLYKRVTANTVQHWVNRFVSQVICNTFRTDQSHLTPILDNHKLVERFKMAKKRVFLFDYDGTLTPIVTDPAAATPSDGLKRDLRALGKDPRNAIWIISGRDSAFLDKWLGDITELGMSAEHGCFMKNPGSTEWENLAANFDMSWQKDVNDIFQYYTERTQGSHIERKRVALTWHYRRADPEFGLFQARECRAHLEQAVVPRWDVEVMSGKANLEVRPKSVNKGEIVKRLISEYSSEGEPPQFVLCMGDDQTDEDMFKALKDVPDLDSESIFPVMIGPPEKKTTASWHLLEPKGVLEMLNELAVLEGESKM